MNEYLRPVDAALYFAKNESLLLLSEFEADALLRLFWRLAEVRWGGSLQGSSHFVHLILLGSPHSTSHIQDTFDIYFTLLNYTFDFSN